MSRPRWALSMEANFWRSAMAAGMYLHKCASPVPSPPSFTLEIPSTLSTFRGTIVLSFFTPASYVVPKLDTRPQLHRSATAPPAPSANPLQSFPVVVNFHGGGFTIGTSLDDVRWCRAVTQQLDAVVISVGYRLAPEHPFPTAVEDGTDVLLWLETHAALYHLDAARVAISGFSAGGNMCFSVPLRLHHELSLRPRPTSSKIVAIAAFYPSTDFTATRESKRATNARPDKELPKVFTDLFDACYLHPPNDIAMDNPFLSPAMAGDREVLAAFPEDMMLVLCEWDQLRAEGERWRDRLRQLGKNVWSELVEDVAHGWDKGPNPIWEDEKARAVYSRVCAELGRIFYGDGWVSVKDCAAVSTGGLAGAV